jgi:hypothetical protein
MKKPGQPLRAAPGIRMALRQLQVLAQGHALQLVKHRRRRVVQTAVEGSRVSWTTVDVLSRGAGELQVTSA